MESILDYIVSKSWTFFTMFIVLSLVPSILFIHTPVKNLIYRRIIQIGGAVFCFCALMYLLLSHHGFAVQFVSAATNGEKIALIELHYEGDGDGGSYETNRLYIVDALTGERGLRMTVSSSTMLCMSDDGIIFYEWGKAVEYDLISGDVLREWSQEKGFENFTELEQGIAQINYQTSIDKSKNDAWLTIKANTGRDYCYNLLSEEFIEAPYPPSNAENDIEWTSDEIHKGNDYYNREWSFGFETKTGDIENLVRSDKMNDQQYPDEYLFPEIVGVCENEEIFVFSSYTSLERKTVFYTAVNFIGEKLWKLDQHEIISEDKWSTQPSPGIAFTHDHYLYVTAGGAMACVDMTTAQIIWKNAF